MNIKIDELHGTEIALLLQEHLDDMARYSPHGSIHALDLDALRQPEITFWSLWQGEELAGCAALKELSPKHAEIKSMRTAQTFLRQGVAGKILQHMIDVAKTRGYQRLSLETGSMVAFQPARSMYEHFGFEYCQPFADYCEDPYSTFMTKELAV
jgi:putative acetyltransferase